MTLTHEQHELASIFSPDARWLYMGRGQKDTAVLTPTGSEHVFTVWWPRRGDIRPPLYWKKWPHGQLAVPEGVDGFRHASQDSVPILLALLILCKVPIGAREREHARLLLPALELAVDVETDEITRTFPTPPTNYRQTLRSALAHYQESGWTIALDPAEQRHKAPTSSTASRHADGEIWIPSTGHYSALQKLVARPDLFAGDRSEFPRASFDRGGAKGHVELRPMSFEDADILPPEEYNALVDNMWAQRGELSDLDADTLDALSTAWIGKATSQDEEIRVGLDELLQLRGVAPKMSGTGRRGGYEPEQRNAQLRCLLHIHNTWVTAHAAVTEEGKRGRHKRSVQLFQSPAFVMTGRTGQLRLDGTMKVEDVYITPGRAFRPFFFGPGRQVALLSSQALKYNSRHRAVEKRLIRYLSWRWRCGAGGGDLVQRTKIDTLLTEAGIRILAREPARTRDRLEGALERLAEDGVIAAWQYEAGWNDDDLPRRGWLQRWREAVVIVEAPDSIKDAYQQLASTDQLVAKDPLETVGLLVRRRRRDLGLSQVALAEALEISQATLSRAENGHKCSRKIADCLQGWLDQTSPR